MNRLISFLTTVGLMLPGISGADEVLHFSRREVDSAFAVGRPLTENSRFKIHASRRDAPGVGEVHAVDTDILYVLSGRATLVTGGALVAPKRIGPNELRGERIEGGAELVIAAGDVVVVPSGAPHWFKKIDGPLTYYVVKTTDCEEAR